MTDRVADQENENILDGLIRVNKEVLVELGLPEDQAGQMADALCRRMMSEYGGEPLYIPKGRSWQLEERYEKIFAEFNGRNHRQLAKKYNCTVRWIQEIVREAAKRNFERRQSKLFQEDA
jgi:Mor family transcriptional regulator